MTAGFHPPVINLRHGAKHGFFKHIVLMGLTEHLEFPMHAKVGVSWLARCNCGVGVVIFFAFMFYAVWAEKSYLYKVDVNGVARLEMRHPVIDSQSHLPDACSALAPNCQSNYEDISNLTYCFPDADSVAPCAGGRCPCRYLDTFDVLKSTNVEQRHLFLPLRYSEFEQTALCPDSNCEKRFSIEGKGEHYVADIEHFTITIDHAFVAQQLEMELSANQCVGFIHLCAPIGHEGEEVCGNIYMEGSGSDIEKESDVEALKEIWMEVEPAEKEHEFHEYWKDKVPMRSGKLGDVLFVGKMLDALHENLTKVHPTNENRTLRDLGFIMMLEYEYHNWKEESMPNSYAPVYVVKANVLPQSEYKVASMIPGVDRNKRTIQEKFGILFAVKQDGNIGKLNGRAVLFIFIEISVLIGLGKYITLCCGLNMIKDQEKARTFEVGVMPEVPKDSEKHKFGAQHTIARGFTFEDEQGSDEEELLEEGTKQRRQSSRRTSQKP